MNRNKWYFTLIAVLVVAAIALAAGCAPTTPGKPSAKPTINSFTANPATITAGQRTKLSWNVSGAATIDMQPGIGSVGATDSLELSPAANTTYTLTASNQVGSTTNSVTVTVTPVVTGKADLVVTDMWLTGSLINYKIKNQGTAPSKPSWTSFSLVYVEDYVVKELGKATDFVDTLAAGQERTSGFTNLDWRYGSIDPHTSEIVTYNLKACADMNNQVDESSKDNNCLTEVWGPPFSYDFFKNAHLATWTSSGSGESLRFPGNPSEAKGAAWTRTYAPYLIMMPPQVSNGWIMGRFSDFYVHGESFQPLSRPFVVPIKSKFSSGVRISPEAKSTDGVSIALGYIDQIGNVVFFPKMDVYSDGKPRTYEVDLNPIAGKKTEFILWVEAKGSPEGDWLEWMGPQIVQMEGLP
jgi:hypothetical protein